MSTVLVMSDGTASLNFTLAWEFWTSILGFIISLLILSYKLGYEKGKKETCHDQYTLGVEKGKYLTDEAKYKEGFSAGKKDFRNSTHILNDVSCKHYPKDEVLKHISIIKKRGDATVVDVECPYIESDNICYLINKKCIKFTTSI